MKIIAFDLGANMAFATNIDSVWCRHLVAKGTRIERSVQTLSWLKALYDMLEKQEALPDVVVYERPFVRGADATRCLWGIAGLIEAVFGKGCAVLDMSPGEVKKHSTGNGKADKNEMTMAAMTMGYQGDNEHEADAFCLLRFAEDTFTKDPSTWATVQPTQRSSSSSALSPTSPASPRPARAKAKGRTTAS